jgi:hypothetical protein
MTEAEWLSGADPQAMLEFLDGKTTPRKLRLFACACCRQAQVWRHLTAQESRRTVEASEQFADELIPSEQLTAASLLAPQGHRTGGISRPVRLSLHDQALRAAVVTARTDAWEAASETLRMTGNLLGSVQATLLLESFGNLPFHPFPLDPAVLRWHDATVPKLARAIYDEQAFYRMPILADALQDAGCDHEPTLSHLSGPGPHVPGCWCLDLLLDRT